MNSVFRTVSKAIIALISLAVLLSSFVSTSPVSFLDLHCNITFNFNDSSGNRIKSTDDVLVACGDAEFKAENEEDKCWTRCYYERTELFFKNGTYNPDKMTDFYLRFSNATDGYIQQVSTIYEKCVGDARHGVDEMKKENKTITKCTFFDEYNFCVIMQALKLTMLESRDNSTANVCGI